MQCCKKLFLSVSTLGSVWTIERQHWKYYIAAFLQINSLFPFNSCLINMPYEHSILYSPLTIFILHYIETPKDNPSDTFPLPKQL